MYSLEWKEHARDNLEKLESSVARRIIIIKIEEMRQNPFSCSIKKLKGFQNLYRIRIGDFRTIFELDSNLIIILKIGHRKSIRD